MSAVSSLYKLSLLLMVVGSAARQADAIALEAAPSSGRLVASVRAAAVKAQTATTTKVYVCSQIGCPADGRTAIDAVVQPLLAAASASSPVVLVLDGPLYMTCGLYISEAGYTEIRGLGAGTTRLKILSHCNQNVIRVGKAANVPTDTGVIPPQTAAQIYIHDLTFDGNRGTGYSYPLGTGTAVGNGNSTSPDQRGYFYGQNGQTGPSRILSDLDITNAHDVWVDHVDFENAPCFSFRTSNVTNILVSNDRFMPFGTNPPEVNTNTDGMHFSGYTNNAVIENAYCRTGDDCIAFNAPEGTSGDIQNVRLSNLVLDQAQTGIRIYATAQSKAAGIIDQLDIDGVTGSANANVFTVGVEGQHPQTYTDVMRNITIRNVHVSAPYFMWINDSVESMQISDSTWKESTLAGGMIRAWFNNTTWGSLTLTNCGILRTSQGSGANAIIDTATMFNGTGVAIKRLTLTNFTVQDVGASQDAIVYGRIPVLNFKPGTTVDVFNTTNLSSAFDRVLDINGNPATSAEFQSVFTAQGQVQQASLAKLATSALSGGGYAPALFAGGMPTPLTGDSANGNTSSASADTRGANDPNNGTFAPYTPPVRNDSPTVNTPQGVDVANRSILQAAVQAPPTVGTAVSTATPQAVVPTSVTSLVHTQPVPRRRVKPNMSRLARRAVMSSSRPRQPKTRRAYISRATASHRERPVRPSRVGHSRRA